MAVDTYIGPALERALRSRLLSESAEAVATSASVALQMVRIPTDACRSPRAGTTQTSPITRKSLWHTETAGGPVRQGQRAAGTGRRGARRRAGAAGSDTACAGPWMGNVHAAAAPRFGVSLTCPHRVFTCALLPGIQRHCGDGCAAQQHGRGHCAHPLAEPEQAGRTERAGKRRRRWAACAQFNGAHITRASS